MVFWQRKVLECQNVGLWLQKYIRKSSTLMFFDLQYRTFVPKWKVKCHPLLLLEMSLFTYDFLISYGLCIKKLCRMTCVHIFFSSKVCHDVQIWRRYSMCHLSPSNEHSALYLQISFTLSQSSCENIVLRFAFISRNIQNNLQIFLVPKIIYYDT